MMCLRLCSTTQLGTGLLLTTHVSISRRPTSICHKVNIGQCLVVSYIDVARNSYNIRPTSLVLENEVEREKI